MKHAINHIHFVGIGGVGMSGIAEVLLNLGYTITGSDLVDSVAVERLKKQGAQVFIGHDAAHVQNANVVVISSAVHEDNPEVIGARERRIPVVPRAVMLAELMRLRKGIAIAGTHGKTTTTSLVASILGEAGLDPTFVIGGKLNSVGVNARLGSGDYLVAEADESDASFLNLSPVMSVVTNIDEDHMDTYGHDRHKLDQAFIDFLHRMPFYGAAIVCVDDPGVQVILPQVLRPIIRYGLSEQAQVRAVDVETLPGGRMRFVVKRQNRSTLPDLPVTLNLAGMHNVRNALAAIAIGSTVGAPDEAMIRALAQFQGVGRRFQRYGEVPIPGGAFTLVDDYGHHPVEMNATIEAARGAFPGRRLIVAFQPHRYTRTRDCFEDLVKVLSLVDVLLLSEVYAAGEEPLVAADGRALARAIRVMGKVEPLFVDDIANMPQAILDTVQPGDVVFTMGAGSIGAVPGKVIDLVQNNHAASLKDKGV